VRREELRHVVVEEGEARGSEPESVRGEIELAADDGRFELRGAIAAIAEAGADAIEVAEQVEVDRRIGGQGLSVSGSMRS